MPPYGWEDYELLLRLGKTGRHVVFIGGEPLSYYRTHALNMSQNCKPDQFNQLVYYLRQKYPVKQNLRDSDTLENQTYYFAEHDPQLKIEFDKKLPVELVVIDVEYLKTGMEIIRDMERFNIQGSEKKIEHPKIKNRFLFRMTKLLTMLHPAIFAPNFWKRRSIKNEIRLIKKSGLFDVDYYRRNNPDLHDPGIDAVKHFLMHGGLERRNPSEKFNSSYYLEQNPDVKASGMNPLLHFVRFGKVEGRKPLAWNNEIVK